MNILDTTISQLSTTRNIQLSNRKNWIDAIDLVRSGDCVHVVDGKEREVSLEPCKGCRGTGETSTAHVHFSKCHQCGGCGENLNLPACDNSGQCS